MRDVTIFSFNYFFFPLDDESATNTRQEASGSEKPANQLTDEE